MLLVGAEAALDGDGDGGGGAAHDGDAAADQLGAVHEAGAELLGAGGDDGGGAAAVEVDLALGRVAEGLGGGEGEDVGVGAAELEGDGVLGVRAAEDEAAVEVVLFEEVVGEDHLGIEARPGGDGSH